MASDTEYDYPSAPELPVDDSVDQTPEDPIEAAAARRTQAATDAHLQFLQQQQDRLNTKWHGSDTSIDSSSIASLRSAVQEGKMDPADFFLKTAQLYGRPRIYAGPRQSMESGNRENELNNPGIHVDATGLDRWHQMNPNGKPAASSTLGNTPNLPKIQLPITPAKSPQAPMTLQRSSIDLNTGSVTKDFSTPYMTVSSQSNPNPGMRKALDQVVSTAPNATDRRPRRPI